MVFVCNHISYSSGREYRMAEARKHCILNHYKDNIEVYSRTSGEGANQERSVTIVS